jgi:hypothetical protein
MLGPVPLVVRDEPPVKKLVGPLGCGEVIVGSWWLIDDRTSVDDITSPMLRKNALAGGVRGAKAVGL